MVNLWLDSILKVFSNTNESMFLYLNNFLRSPVKFCQIIERNLDKIPLLAVSVVEMINNACKPDITLARGKSLLALSVLLVFSLIYTVILERPQKISSSNQS